MIGLLILEVIHDAAQQAGALLNGGHGLKWEAHNHSAVAHSLAGNCGGQAVLAISHPGKATVITGTDGIGRLDGINLIVQLADESPCTWRG